MAIAAFLALASIGVQVGPVAAVILPAHITKSFGATAVLPGGTTSLTFDIYNPNQTFGSLTNVGFTDTFPPGLVIASTSGLDNGCGGTLTTASTSVTLSGATLAPGVLCVISGITVQGQQLGSLDNSVTVSSSAGGDTSSAILLVADPPSTRVLFGTANFGALDWATPGMTVGLEIEIDNPNIATPLTGVGFSSTLPAGLTIANPNGLAVSGGCTSAEVSAVAGSHTLSLTGAALDASNGNPVHPILTASCDIALDLVASTSGAKVFSTGPVSSNQIGSGAAGTATLPVVGPGSRVYTGTFVSGGTLGYVDFARTDGSVGAPFAQSSGSGGILGTAIDAAAGRIYFTDLHNAVIRWASLDDTTHGTVATTGASVSGPEGLAINPLAGRLYWANVQSNTISYADLKASSAGDLYTVTNEGSAFLDEPNGVAIDAAGGRIYWTNGGLSHPGIFYANLDGSGGGHALNTTGATVQGPIGLALDTVHGLVYWSNAGGNKISYAHLSGSGGGNLATTGAQVSEPAGVSLDPTGHKLWWGNFTGTAISYLTLDSTGTVGSAGGTLATPGVTLTDPTFPSLLYPPTSTAAPKLTGTGAAGSVLTCSKGSWAGDTLGAFLYRAPRSLSYHWQNSGTTISGATSSTYTPSATGNYTCSVTATNAAGSATSPVSNLVDSVPPTVTAPSAIAPTGATIGSTVPIKLTWTGSDSGSGIGHYEVSMSTNGGSYVVVASPTTATYTRSISPSTTTTYRFRVRAFDQAGNASAYAYGSTFHVTLVQQSSGSITWSGSWSTVSSTSASGGSYRYTASTGASVSYTFTGRSVSVVALLSSGYGSFKLYLDGVALTTTYSEYAATSEYQRIVFSKTWSTSASHTIKLVSLGTSGHPRVNLDAVVVLE